MSNLYEAAQRRQYLRERLAKATGNKRNRKPESATPGVSQSLTERAKSSLQANKIDSAPVTPSTQQTATGTATARRFISEADLREAGEAPGDTSKVRVLLKKPTTRAATGQFAVPGSVGHFAAHRREYAQQKADGLVGGSKKDYKLHLNQWHEKKHAMLVELIKELEHTKIEQHGLTGRDLARCKRRCDRLEGRIARLRKQFKQ